MDIGGIGINWFDFLVVTVIGIGVVRGRSRGMSVELLDVVKWMCIVVAAGLSYRPLGQFVADYTHIGYISGYIIAYLFVLLLVRTFFGWMKRMVGEKLVGSDVFGSWEYYLGMIAGGVRFGCVLMACMALLNAAFVPPDKLAEQVKKQKVIFGDNYFPTPAGLQQNVFAGSASGRFARRYLAQELIVVSAADRIPRTRDTLGRQEERAISEILGEKK
jgi:uncharacterized membrane protein required for colicin V production